MAIRIHCPSGHLLEIDARCAGLRIRCGRCGKVFRASPELRRGDGGLVPKSPSPQILKSPKHPSPVLAPPPDSDIEATSLVVGAMMERIGDHGKSLPGDYAGPLGMAPQGIYEAPPSQIRAVYGLAAQLAALVLLSLAPLALTGEINLAISPPWAQAVLLVAGLQVFYIAWMVNGPDWASARAVMFLFATVAGVYAVATTAVMATPLDHPLPLELGPVRHQAAAWCAASVLVMALGTFLAGRLATRWQRRFQEETARRG